MRLIIDLLVQANYVNGAHGEFYTPKHNCSDYKQSPVIKLAIPYPITYKMSHLLTWQLNSYRQHKLSSATIDLDHRWKSVHYLMAIGAGLGPAVFHIEFLVRVGKTCDT